MRKRERIKKILLNEGEFEYMQRMLDYGSTMNQALLDVRPELNDEKWDLKDSIIMLKRRPLKVIQPPHLS